MVDDDNNDEDSAKHKAVGDNMRNLKTESPDNDREENQNRLSISFGDFDDGELDDTIFEDAEVDPDFVPTGTKASASPTQEPRRSQRKRVPVHRPDFISYLACDREPNDPVSLSEAMQPNGNGRWKTS